MTVKRHFVKETVLASFKKAADLETHVRLVQVEDRQVLEFRDYIPSLGEYGRGYWFSPDDRAGLNEVVNALIEVLNGEVL